MSNGPPQHFYYAGDQRVELEPLADTVAVAFSEAIPPRRLAELEARDRPVDRLAQSPALLARNIVVHQTPPPVHGVGRLEEMAERLETGETVRFVTATFRHPATGQHFILTDEIIVRFQPTVTKEQIGAFIAEMGLEILSENEYVSNQYLMRVLSPTLTSPLEVANRCHEHELVMMAVPNFVREMDLRQTDFRPRQWHLTNTGQGGGVAGEDVRRDGAWEITRGHGNVVIGILDSGVDTDHPDLAPNLNPNGRNFDDPNHPADPDADDLLGPSDAALEAAHGTNCAGIAAGVGVQISGIAPRCQILPIKMLSATDNDIADSIFYASQHAPVLSNSWGSPASNPVVNNAIQQVIVEGREGKGTVVLFAAGNDNAPIPVGDQSRVPGVISIGASTNVGSRAGYSNFGELVENPPNQKRISVVAPSGPSANFPDNGTEGIYTTDILGEFGANGPGAVDDANTPVVEFDYTGEFDGTSAACPLVAGVAALMLSVHADLTAAQVRYILEATADKIGTGLPRPDAPIGNIPPGQNANYDLNGYDQFTHTDKRHYSRYGFGRVNAEQAVKVARGDAFRQAVHDPAAPLPTLAEAIPVTLRRVNGSNRYVSDVIQLVDARCDLVTLTAPDRLFVGGGPGGFLRATFQPATGGPAVTDEVDIAGEIVI